MQANFHFIHFNMRKYSSFLQKALDKMQVLRHNGVAAREAINTMLSEGSCINMMRAVVEFRDFLKNVRSFKWELISMPAQAWSFGNGNMAELIYSVENNNRNYRR